MTTPNDAFGKLSTDLNTLLQRTVAEIGNRLVAKTPVLTGEARAGWNASTDTPDLTHDATKRDLSGTSTIADIASYAATLPNGSSLHFISNGTPYIEQLEMGSSEQNPTGMARTTELEIGAIVDEAARGLF